MASKPSPPSSSTPLSPSPSAQLHAAVDSDDPAVVGLGPACAAAYAKLEVCTGSCFFARDEGEMSNLDLDLLFSPHSTLTLTHQLRKPPIPTRPGLPRRERPRLDGLSAAGEGAQRVHVASSLLERKEEEDLERRRKTLQ